MTRQTPIARHHSVAMIVLGVLAIAAAGWYAFIPALHGEWVWDDRTEISENAVLRDVHGLQNIWRGVGGTDYFPLKSTLQWLQWRCWGDHPFGYHVTNVTLHLASALVLWWLLRKLGVRFGWAGAFIFAIHPLTVESVAWVAEFKNTLSLLPLLSAAGLFVVYEQRHRTGAYVAALLLFLVAGLCKTSVVMFPVVLLLYVWWKRRTLRWADLTTALPFFGISLVLGLVTMWFQNTRAAAGWDIPIGDWWSRTTTSGLAMAFYLWKTVWPSGLMPVYPRPSGSAEWSGIMAWLVLGMVGWCSWRRRSTFGWHVLLGLGWFMLNLLPVVGLLRMSFLHISWVADHFVYLPLIGVIGLGTSAAGWLLDSIRPSARWYAVIPFVALCVVLGLQTRRQSALFAREASLWRYALEQNPKAWLAYNNLGYVLLGENKGSEAVPLFTEAIRLKPDYGDAHSNLVLALLDAGRLNEAIAASATAAERGILSAPADINLSASLLRAGRIPEAILYSERALRISPNDGRAHKNLADALLVSGRTSEALAHYDTAVRFNPTADAYSNYGAALHQTGKLNEAINAYRYALKLQPDFADAQFNLALALSKTGRPTEARHELEQLLERHPAHVAAHYELGNLLHASGDRTGAVTEFTNALRYDPQFAPARAGLQRVGNPAQ
jgi:protein O-mannosyl-transferase